MYVLQTSLRLMADYTLLLAAYAARISQQEQLPRWSASRFCLSLTHSLALRAILLLAELWPHSLTRCCWID